MVTVAAADSFSAVVSFVDVFFVCAAVVCLLPVTSLIRGMPEFRESLREFRHELREFRHELLEFRQVLLELEPSYLTGT